MFYWANWLAWAPVTAVFLGRISIGGRASIEEVDAHILVAFSLGAPQHGGFYGDDVIGRDRVDLTLELKRLTRPQRTPRFFQTDAD